MNIENEPVKLCIKCKHLIGNRNYPEWSEGKEKFKCGAPQNVRHKELDLVTGLVIIFYHTTLCSENRKNFHHPEITTPHCGKEGNWYELYQKPLPQVIYDPKTSDGFELETMKPIKIKKKLSDDDLQNL